MYIIKYFHSPNIVDLMHIVLEKPKLKKLLWPLNYENEAKVRWHLQVRHVHLTIIPYTKYRWPIAYSIRKTDKKKKQTEL